MRLGKRAMLILSFTLGACLFVTTALADMAIGTGYDRLKDTVKYTTTQMEEGLDSYTMESRALIQVDGLDLYESTSTLKVDTINRASERDDGFSRFNTEIRSSHSYSDEHTSAWKQNDDKQYRVSEYPEADNGWNLYSNPLDGEGVEDFEKIIDALVGNLKDDVIVEERSDGGKVYRGSLSEAQVPTLVNAVLSFVVKQTVLDHMRIGEANVPTTEKLPRIEQDIYVKKITGYAVENDAGVIEQISGEAVMSGADASGERHEIAYSFAVHITDIGNTTVSKPDLTDAIVVEKNRSHEFMSKHIGTYRNNILIETDDELIKIGERTVEITGVDKEKVTGRYFETLDPEYAEHFQREPLSFDFESEPTQMHWTTVIKYTDENGQEFYGEIYPSGLGKVHLYIQSDLDEDGHLVYNWDRLDNFDSDFIRVFD